MLLLNNAEFSVVAITCSLVSACFTEWLMPAYQQKRNPGLQLFEGMLAITLHYAIGIELLSLLVPLEYVFYPMTALVVFAPVMLPQAYQKMSGFMAQVTDTVRPMLPDYSLLPPPEFSKQWTLDVGTQCGEILAEITTLTNAMKQVSDELNDAIAAQQTRLQGDATARTQAIKALSDEWKALQTRLKEVLKSHDAKLETWKTHINLLLETADKAAKAFGNDVLDRLKALKQQNTDQYDDIRTRMDILMGEVIRAQGFVKAVQATLAAAGVSAGTYKTALLADIQKLQQTLLQDVNTTQKVLAIEQCAVQQQQNQTPNTRFQYNLSKQQCEVIALSPGDTGYVPPDNGTTPPQCPPGHTYNTVTAKCDPVPVVDPNGNPYCADGYYWDNEEGKCNRAPYIDPN